MSVAKTLGLTNPPGSLNAMLRNNSYTAIPSGAFAGTVVTSIDLSYNNITSVAQDAFTYNFNVQTLDLSKNQLGVVPTGTLNTLPALRDFRISDNKIWAIQQSNTHLSSAENAAGNVIQCSAFGANTAGCTCPLAGYNLSLHCGYWRCTQEPNGCPPEQIFNSSDCSNAPGSLCVNTSHIPPDQYYGLQHSSIFTCPRQLQLGFPWCIAPIISGFRSNANHKSDLLDLRHLPKRV
jgi:hypothetical protein